MNPINFLNRFKRKVEVIGKGQEYVVLFRSEKSNTQTNFNYVRKCVVDKASKITYGDIIASDSKRYFVIGVLSPEVKILEAFADITISKITNKYVNGNKVGVELVDVATGIPAFHSDVSGNMRLYDAGLLSDTVKKFVVQSNDAIKVDLTIILGEEKYCIKAINKTKYPNMYELQVAIETRKTT